MNRKKLIEPLFLRLVSTRSDTNTLYESVIGETILSWIKSREYFKSYPEHTGAALLEDDTNSREVIWALVKGNNQNDETIILINHYDTVDSYEYGKIQHLALRPDELKNELSKRNFGKNIRLDLESKDWIFGRGTADMKAGVAIHLSLIEEFSKENFNGNILFLSVPDEETLSRGMLSAVKLIHDLKEKYRLKYILTINSEPYYNMMKNKAIIYEGSVGKIMPVVYVKGVKSHVGDPYNGINPSLILANIQMLTELNVNLSDKVEFDATPPPIWVNLKDRKKAYDASIPEAATGYFNWLTFTKTPTEILEKMITISEKALEVTLNHFSKSYSEFCKLTNDVEEEMRFIPNTFTFEDIFKEAIVKGGTSFINSYEDFQKDIKELVDKNEITLPEGTIRLLEYTADYIDLEGPSVVVAISGPYYPHISNFLIKNGDRFTLSNRVNKISKELYNVEYEKNLYFMGMSDLSYAGWLGNQEDIDVITANSPGWGNLYSVPFDEMRTLDMPVVNIGPWGKDLHKITERVYGPDVYERVPEIISRLIKELLDS